MRPVIGIDPGLSGGIAVIDLDARRILGANDIPTIGDDSKKRVDALAIKKWLVPFMNFGIRAAYCERASAMPSIPGKDGKRRDAGAASAFNYGRGVGYLEAVFVMLELPLLHVEARGWSQHFQLASGEDKKERSRQLVLQRYPAAHELFELKKHHGRAEAVLIAEFGDFKHKR